MSLMCFSAKPSFMYPYLDILSVLFSVSLFNCLFHSIAVGTLLKDTGLCSVCLLDEGSA